jgi:hypothetical protein
MDAQTRSTPNKMAYQREVFALEMIEEATTRKER